MDFSNAFLANFLGTLTATLVAALPLLAIWAFIRSRNSRLKRFWSRSAASASLRVRFFWLMIKGKRKRSEYKAWASSERTRKYMINLVRNGGRARLQVLASLGESAANISKYLDDVFSTGPSVSWLGEYAGRMKMGEWGNPPESHPDLVAPEERMEWLKSQPLDELGEWSVRLSDEDREAWLSWLTSKDCKEQSGLLSESDGDS